MLWNNVLFILHIRNIWGKITQNVLTNKYKEPVKIKKAKLDDVMILLGYIPPIYHKFYKNLKYENDTTAEEIENID